MLVLGLDPGNNTGIALVEVSDDYNTLDVLYTETFEVTKPSTIYQYTNTIPNTLSTYMLKYTVLTNKIAELVSLYSVEGVCCEDVYVHPRFPQATESLMRYISAIETILHYNFDMKVQFIHNRVIKKFLAEGTKSKTDIQTAIKSKENIIFHNDNPSMTEHEYDAVSIVYAFTKFVKGIDPLS